MTNDCIDLSAEHESYKPSLWEGRALFLSCIGIAVSLAWAFSPWLALVVGIDSIRGLWNFEMDTEGRPSRKIGAEVNRWMIGRSVALKNAVLGLLSKLAKPSPIAHRKPEFLKKTKAWTPRERLSGKFMIAAMMLVLALASFEVLLNVIWLLPDLPLLHVSTLGFLALFFWFSIQEYRASKKWMFR